MKKSLLVFLLVLVVILSLSACNRGQQNETTSPTDSPSESPTTNGSGPQACVHEIVEVPAVNATCTTPGSTAGKYCALCEEVISSPKEIPALGHTEVVDATKAPTCTETGLTEGKH